MPSYKKEKSLKKKYSLFFSTRRDIPEPEPEPDDSVEGIYPWLEDFKSSLEETDPLLRNMDKSMLQKMSEDKDKRVIKKYEIWKDH